MNLNAKNVIEKIRKTRFGIGLDLSKLPDEYKDYKDSIIDKEEFVAAATRLAREIHTRKPHVLFELIQNADDNEYEKGIIPTIRFENHKDYLLIQNNEKGFKEKDMWAICGIGKTTKKDKVKGYIGEKGIGFKSVFMIADRVQIYSNGFNFEFKYDSDNPTSMILPYWIDKVPKFIRKDLTNIVLFKKEALRNSMWKYLSEIRPELLLFLNKLRVIEIKDMVEGEFRRFEMIEMNNNTAKVKVSHNNSEEIKSWKIFKKGVHIPEELMVAERQGVKKTEIVLAFPLNHNNTPRFDTDESLFAFLPVRKYGFKFLIHADFLLPITREDILKDNVWNLYLRESIPELILEILSDLKNDKRFSMQFLNYFDFRKVNDEFFAQMGESIINKLRTQNVIYSASGKWLSPDKVLFATDELRNILSNEDVKFLFGKEYVSDDFKVNKILLKKLGVQDLTKEMLFEALENYEWIRFKDREWFSKLYEYLSSIELDYQEIESLKRMRVVLLENGKITSLDDGAVFFPFAKRKKYGFEKDVRILNRKIMHLIADLERKDEVVNFLKRMGIRPPDAYEIIENYIKPVFEEGDYRSKNIDELIGYVRFIKDYHDVYESKSHKSPESIGNWLMLRVKTGSRKIEYRKANEIYLTREYGNKNDLEELFEGIKVPFLHSCYLRKELEELSTRERRNKKVKTADLKARKQKIIKKWRDFFLRVGVHELPRIVRYMGYLSKWEPYPKKEDRELDREEWVDDYRPSMEIKDVIECEDEEKISKLLKVFDANWDEYYSKFTEMRYKWKYYKWNGKTLASSFMIMLRERLRIPATDGKLHRPGEVFLKSKKFEDVFGDDVPYVKVELKSSNFIDAIGINSTLSTKVILDYLKQLAKRSESVDFKKIKAIYTLLDREATFEDFEVLYNAFNEDNLILTPDTERKVCRFYTADAVIWDDESGILRRYGFPVLKPLYQQLSRLFLSILSVKETPETDDYVRVIEIISKKKEIHPDDEKTVWKIYEILADLAEGGENLKEKLQNREIFFTQKGKFVSYSEIIMADNVKLYEIFSKSEKLNLLYLPENVRIQNVWPLIVGLGIPFLSGLLSAVPMVDDDEPNEVDPKLTGIFKRILPFVKRYLYWEEPEQYQILEQKGVFERLKKLEVVLVKNLKVKYALEYKGNKLEEIRDEKCFFYGNKFYVRADIRNSYEVPVEFSKIFGNVKGLANLLLMLVEHADEAEKIMAIQNIRPIPAEVEEEIIESDSEFDGFISSEPDYVKIEEVLTEPVEPTSDIKEDVNTNSSNHIEHVELSVSSSRIFERESRESNGTNRVRGHASVEGRTGGIFAEDADEIGRLGERIVFEYLKEKYGKRHPDAEIKETTNGFAIKEEGKEVLKVVWLNKFMEEGKPYDIKIQEGEEEYFLEVKSTVDEKKAVFLITGNQWNFMKEKKDKYAIFRVYGAGSANPSIDVMYNPYQLWLDGKINATLIKIYI